MKRNQSMIAQVVGEMGGRIEKIIPERGCFYIHIKGEKIFVSRKFKIVTSPIAGKELTAFKDLTHLLLKEKGLPTPNAVCFYRKTLTTINLDEKLNTLKYPIVIKDATGSNSRGVFVNIKNIQEAKEIILREMQNFSSLVAQEMVFGKEYRVLVLKNKAIGVLEMIPPRIFGNGKNTVKELILKKQEKIKKKTSFDNALDEILKKQNVTLESVPENNQTIFIKNNSCLNEGGETKDVTDLINKNLEYLCVQAAKTVGNYLVGIDIICDDISTDPQKQNVKILEINGKPDLYIHYSPTHGKNRNVIKNIIEFILELRRQRY